MEHVQTITQPQHSLVSEHLCTEHQASEVLTNFQVFMMIVQQWADETENRAILKRFIFETLRVTAKVNQEEHWTSA